MSTDDRQKVAQARMRLAYRLVSAALEIDAHLLYDPEYRKACDSLLPWSDERQEKSKRRVIAKTATTET